MRQPVELTQARLKELLSYCAASGEFRWKGMSPRTPAGKLAGNVGNHGYIRVRIGGVLRRAHRLAWLWVHGRMPSNGIDHINGIRADNRICNLREASAAQNNQNLPIYKTNTSGCPGVNQARNGKWRVRLRVANKRLCIGTFNSRDSAVEAYLAAKAELHKFSPSVRSGVAHG